MHKQRVGKQVGKGTCIQHVGCDNTGPAQVSDWCTASRLTHTAFAQILGEGNAQYVAKDYTSAGDIFTFLTTVTAPCLSGAAGPLNCNATFAQVGLRAGFY